MSVGTYPSRIFRNRLRFHWVSSRNPVRYSTRRCTLPLNHWNHCFAYRFAGLRYDEYMARKETFLALWNTCLASRSQHSKSSRYSVPHAGAESHPKICIELRRNKFILFAAQVQFQSTKVKCTIWKRFATQMFSPRRNEVQWTPKWSVNHVLYLGEIARRWERMRSLYFVNKISRFWYLFLLSDFSSIVERSVYQFQFHWVVSVGMWLQTLSPFINVCIRREHFSIRIVLKLTAFPCANTFHKI